MTKNPEDVAPERPMKKYRIRARECVSLKHFYDEAEAVFALTDEDWKRDLPSLKQALVWGGAIIFPSRIVIYDGNWAAGEVPEWCDILATLMDQELVKRGCEVKIKNEGRKDPALDKIF